MHIKTTSYRNLSRRIILRAPLFALLALPLMATEADNDAAPLSAWDDIIARAQASEAAGKTGWDRDRVSLQTREVLKDYYAKFAGWTPPPPLAVQNGYLRNLPEKPLEPRFPLTGKVWPETVGEASICLWEDDKLAAASVSVDDNCALDLPAWRKISEQYGGLAVTWNLITREISDNASSNVGDWQTWQQVIDEGFRVESHSVTHVGDPVREDGWPGPEWEAWESKKAIEQNLLDYQVRLFVFPGAALKPFQVSSNWRDNLTDYYLGARGFSGSPISPANQIDYFDIRTTANPGPFIDTPDTANDWTRKNQYSQILNPSPDNPNYRGWASVFTHYLGMKEGEDLATSEKPYFQALHQLFTFFNDNRKDIWIGTLGDIATYGQERDTATLVTTESNQTRIVLELTSLMDPTLFNYPLTVKVRLSDTWKSCRAKQDNQLIPVTVVNHEGVRYALVKARPNNGPVTLAE